MKEFEVKTKCGRNFIWSGFDKASCRRDVEYHGYTIVSIKEHKHEVAV